MIKAAFFDLDDTLCDDSAAWRECAHAAVELASSRIPRIDIVRLERTFLDISEKYWSNLDYFKETRTMQALRTDQFRQALDEIGVVNNELAHAMAEHYGRFRSRDIRLFPDALSTVDALHCRGIKLACITNGLAATHEEKVAHLGIDVAFDHVLIASLIGYIKPDARIFRHALDLCECDADEAVMIGDDLHRDIAGAQAAGIRAYWYNPGDRERLPGDPEPNGVLRTLASLLDLAELFDS